MLNCSGMSYLDQIVKQDSRYRYLYQICSGVTFYATLCVWEEILIVWIWLNGYVISFGNNRYA